MIVMVVVTDDNDGLVRVFLWNTLFSMFLACVWDRAKTEK